MYQVSHYFVIIPSGRHPQGPYTGTTGPARIFLPDKRSSGQQTTNLMGEPVADWYESMNQRNYDTAGGIPALILCLCILLGLVAIPAAAEDTRAIVTVQELNVTNASLANATIPAQYQATPTLLEVGISSNGSLPEGPKGEMSAGPRTIGFSTTPEMIAVIIVVIAAIGIGAWYLMKRSRDGKNKE